jgi:hypothetical protein
MIGAYVVLALIVGLVGTIVFYRIKWARAKNVEDRARDVRLNKEIKDAKAQQR